MDIEAIAKIAQNCFASNPVVILGSGASAPHGLPGMTELKDYLEANVEAVGTAEEDAWLGDLLPILDIGEALVVGDACLLPTRVRVAEPKRKPNSQTVAFWDCWNEADAKSDTENAVKAWRRQSFQK